MEIPGSYASWSLQQTQLQILYEHKAGDSWVFAMFFIYGFSTKLSAQYTQQI
jgi:hypothetical protein